MLLNVNFVSYFLIPTCLFVCYTNVAINICTFWNYFVVKLQILQDCNFFIDFALCSVNAKKLEWLINVMNIMYLDLNTNGDNLKTGFMLWLMTNK